MIDHLRIIMKHTIAIIYFLFPLFLFSEGFSGKTIVKTANGYTPIEQLHVGDLVISGNGSL